MLGVRPGLAQPLITLLAGDRPRDAASDTLPAKRVRTWALNRRDEDHGTGTTKWRPYCLFWRCQLLHQWQGLFDESDQAVDGRLVHRRRRFVVGLVVADLVSPGDRGKGFVQPDLLHEDLQRLLAVPFPAGAASVMPEVRHR